MNWEEFGKSKLGDRVRLIADNRTGVISDYSDGGFCSFVHVEFDDEPRQEHVFWKRGQAFGYDELELIDNA